MRVVQGGISHVEEQQALAAPMRQGLKGRTVSAFRSEGERTEEWSKSGTPQSTVFAVCRKKPP